jgi:hypothetical protein
LSQKDDHEKQTESLNTTANEINNNVAVDIFGQTFRTETFPSKGLEACQKSEINNNVLDLESHGMIDNRKPMEIETGLNSKMHGLTSKVPIPIDNN